MKVKIFRGGRDMTLLERQINTFISDLLCDVIFVHQSENKDCVTISIWYN